MTLDFDIDFDLSTISALLKLLHGFCDVNVRMQLFSFITYIIINTDKDTRLRIESSAIINLRGVSTKLNNYIVFTMQTYKRLISEFVCTVCPPCDKSETSCYHLVTRLMTVTHCLQNWLAFSNGNQLTSHLGSQLQEPNT